MAERGSVATLWQRRFLALRDENERAAHSTSIENAEIIYATYKKNVFSPLNSKRCFPLRRVDIQYTLSKSIRQKGWQKIKSSMRLRQASASQEGGRPREENEMHSAFAKSIKRLGVVCAALAAFSAPAWAWEPTKNVEFIVPAGTGGGADQMARVLQGIIQKHSLMKQSLVVINKSGGAGAEGFLDMKSSVGTPTRSSLLFQTFSPRPWRPGFHSSGTTSPLSPCWLWTSSSCG